MELRRYLQIVGRKLPLLIVCVLVGAVAAYLVTPRTVRYTATATLYVGSQVVNPDPVSGELTNDRAIAINQFVQTYSEIIRTDASAADAINRTGLAISPESLVAATTATPVENTTLFKVSVTDPDPGKAQTLANALATSFVSRQGELEPTTADAGPTDGADNSAVDGNESSVNAADIGGIPVSVTDPAKLPTVPESIGLTRNLFLGALFGLVIAVAIIGLLEYLDVTIKTAAEAERRLELPVLGALPLHTGRQPGVAAARLNGAGTPARSRA
jgi:receptor protein-tyrosine kinase